MKKLYRLRHGRKLAGVCGGIAEYFDIDSKIVRLLCVVLCFAGGIGVIAYLLFAVFVPKEPKG